MATIMPKQFISILAATSFVWACGGASMPEPRQRLADAQSASRAAVEIGAEKNADARLHVQLAEEQIAAARARMAAGDNERATYLLVRARADAELAVALARQQQALDEKQAAADRAASVTGGTQ